jgi:hypothetical protein
MSELELTDDLTEDQKALLNAEKSEGIEDSGVKKGKATSKKAPLNLNDFAGKEEEFLNEHVNDYDVVKSSELEDNDVVVVNLGTSKEPNVQIVCVSEVKGKTVELKDSILGKPTGKTTAKTLLRINNPGARTNFKGEYKAQLWKIMRKITATTDETCRIGGFLVEDESYKTSEEGKKLQDKVTDYFKEKFGIEVALRYSKKCGAKHDSDSPGFNILAKNPNSSIQTELFRQGSHHYSKLPLYTIVPDGDEKIKVSGGDEKWETMFKEVSELE